MDSILSHRHEKYILRIAELCPMDDVFMNKVFEDGNCVKLLLETVLERDVHIREHEIQKHLDNLQGRSCRLDIFVRDDQGSIYDIEIQKVDEGAIPQRARYYSSLMDGHMLMPRQVYSSLPKKYVIFITENDVLGFNLPVYHICRTIQETGTVFKDEEHMLYVNGSIRDESRLGKLMHDLHCREAGEMYYQEIAQRVRYFKEEEEGIAIMCEIMEEIRREGVEEGIEKGIETGIRKGIETGSKEKLAEIIRRMIDNQFSYSDIALSTGLRVEDIQKYIS